MQAVVAAGSDGSAFGDGLEGLFEVLEAVDGQQALEKAAQFLPDIILSDMMMPEKDGLQVCRELRERTSTRSIPVVLLTARADEKTKIDCLAAGASDFTASQCFSSGSNGMIARLLVVTPLSK